MSLNLDLEKNILQNSKIPRWLQATGKDFSQRPDLDIDDSDGNADAKWIVGYKPSYREKAYKKAKRKIAEAEELHEWIEKKGKEETKTGETKVDDLLDGLDSALNSMI